MGEPFYIRATWFIEQIRSERHPNARSLVEHFDISDATAHRDIDALIKQYSAPITFDGEEKGYRFLDCGDKSPNKKYTLPLPNRWVSSQEIFLLALAKEIMGDDLTREILSGLFEKMKPSNALDYSQEMALERVSYKGMGFYRQREGVFQKVLEALTRLEWIEICHHQIATPPQSCWVNILPLHLVNYINKWYLIAEKEGRLRTYSLSRITEIRKGKNQGTPAFSTEEIKEKLEEVFGIFVTDEEHPLEEITLRCLPQRTPFFESWVFHPKQEQKRDREGRLEIRFLSTVNKELIGEIVRFADQLEVLGPPTLQRELTTFLDRAARLQGTLP